MSRPARLVMVRHGESQGNADELFTGVMDVALTDLGRREAATAAQLLRAAGLWPRHWFVSPMLRSRQTLAVMQAGGPEVAHVEFDGRLLERNYGSLTGQAKAWVRQHHGEELFRTWRRSLDGTPPPLGAEQLAELSAAFDDVPHVELTPTESLRDVMARVGQWWAEDCLPLLRRGEDVLVLAHGNSLRALCAVMYALTDDEVQALNIPNAQPLVHEVGPSQGQDRAGRYLDPATALAAAHRIAAAGGT